MPKPIDWDRIITTDQAAELAGVTKSTICNWIREGRLHGERRGRVLLVDRDAVMSVVTPSVTPNAQDAGKDSGDEQRTAEGGAGRKAG